MKTNLALIEKTVASPAVLPVAKEHYRKLATMAHHAQKERGIKRLVISSAVANEGKTLTTTNLALTLSQSFKRRVLLIDGDLRRPALHDIFEIRLSPGFADVLAGGPQPPPVPSAVTSTLAVLPAGTTAEPIAALSSPNLHALLERAGARFDWVLIDTPPVGLVPDATLVAAQADAVLLVVLAGVTPAELVQDAVEALGRNRVLGVVLNRADHHAVMGGHYYRYYSDYDRYYSESREE